MRTSQVSELTMCPRTLDNPLYTESDYNNFGFDGRATRVNFHNDSVLMVTFTLLLQQHFILPNPMKVRTYPAYACPDLRMPEKSPTAFLAMSAT